MPTITYTYPAPASMDDNLSLTALKLIPIINNCFNPYLDDPCDGWNGTHCNYDPDYFIPVVADDTLFFQFFFKDLFNDWDAPAFGFSDLITIKVYDCAGNELAVNPIIQSAVGKDKSGFAVQWCELDVNQIIELSCCFYFGFTNIGEDKEYFTEKYCCDKCNESILLVVNYDTLPRTDCYGWFHGLPTQVYGDSFSFVLKTRVKGSLRWEGKSITAEEKIRGRGLRKTVQDQYELRAMLLPPFVVAQYLAPILESDYVTDANNTIYYFDGVIENAREGGGDAWNVIIDLTGVVCNSDTKC